jgi:hypothetical protein
MISLWLSDPPEAVYRVSSEAIDGIGGTYVGIPHLQYGVP